MYCVNLESRLKRFFSVLLNNINLNQFESNLKQFQFVCNMHYVKCNECELWLEGATIDFSF